MLWDSPGQNTRVGSRSLLQGIFPTQKSNQGRLHCRQIIYQLRYQGSPKCFGISPNALRFTFLYMFLFPQFIHIDDLTVEPTNIAEPYY